MNRTRGAPTVRPSRRRLPGQPAARRGLDHVAAELFRRFALALLPFTPPGVRLVRARAHSVSRRPRRRPDHGHGSRHAQRRSAGLDGWIERGHRHTRCSRRRRGGQQRRRADVERAGCERCDGRGADGRTTGRRCERRRQHESGREPGPRRRGCHGATSGRASHRRDDGCRGWRSRCNGRTALHLRRQRQVVMPTWPAQQSLPAEVGDHRSACGRRYDGLRAAAYAGGCGSRTSSAPCGISAIRTWW